MTIKAIGAGVGRTGSHSLKLALEQLLGGTSHHMLEVFSHPEEVPVWHAAFEGTLPDWKSFLSGYTSSCDFPSCSFYAELAEAFPEVPVILSTRSAESWYRSASNTIFLAIPNTPPEMQAWRDMAMAMLRERFCDQLDDADAMIAAYEAHNAAVRATIPSSRLVEWTPSDGWAPLCDALGVPVPAEPFPVTNTTDEFRSNMGLPPV